MIFRNIFGLALCIILAGCTGLVGKGDKLYESGLYHEAADSYLRALRKNPDNVDAKIGLDRARYKIIDRGLIEVRMLRLSANMLGATQKLEQILRNQTAWNIELQGAVTATQSEETRYAKRWLLDEAQELSQSTYPDKFRWFQFSYSSLIGNAQIGNQLMQYREAVDQKGERRCEELAKGVANQQFFMHDFVEKYCSAWGKKPALETDRVDFERFNRLALSSNIHYRTQYNNSQRNNFSSLRNTFAQRFKETLWYSPIARETLRLHADGNVDYFYEARDYRRHVNYKVKETVETQGEGGQVLTSSRDVRKTHTYIVRVHSERFDTNITYRGTIQGQEVARNMYRVEENETESHDEYFHDAKLYPRQASFMNISALFSYQVTQLNNDYINALNQHWKTQYCEKQVAKVIGENVMRCGKIDPQNSYVNNWFENTFGISHLDMIELYGI